MEADRDCGYSLARVGVLAHDSDRVNGYRDRAIDCDRDHSWT